MKFIITSADGFHAAAGSVSLVIVSFSRREVESGHIGDALDRLLNLTDNAEQSERFAGSLMFQFEGYDDETREIYEIPEIVTFFRALTSEWAAWYHFLVRAPEVHQFGLLITLLCDVDVVRRGAGVTTRFRNSEQLLAVEQQLEHAVRVLYAHHGWPVDRLMKTITVAQQLAFGV